MSSSAGGGAGGAGGGVAARCGAGSVFLGGDGQAGSSGGSPKRSASSRQRSGELFSSAMNHFFFGVDGCSDASVALTRIRSPGPKLIVREKFCCLPPASV